MPLEPGEAPLGGTETAETRPKDAGVEAGDAVALAGGTAAAANTEANELGGIAGETDRVILDGVVVAAVAAGVAEGARLGAGNATGGTTGQLIADAGGPAVALCGEGGTWHSEEKTYDVPAGYAVVHL